MERLVFSKPSTEPDRKGWFKQLDLKRSSWHPQQWGRKADTLPCPVSLFVWLISFLQKEGHSGPFWGESARWLGNPRPAAVDPAASATWPCLPLSAPSFSLSSSFLLPLFHFFSFSFPRSPCSSLLPQTWGAPTGLVYPVVVQGSARTSLSPQVKTYDTRIPKGY